MSDIEALSTEELKAVAGGVGPVSLPGYTELDVPGSGSAASGRASPIGEGWHNVNPKNVSFGDISTDPITLDQTGGVASEGSLTETPPDDVPF